VARLIDGLKKKDHVTSTLIKLHWLRIEYRILYKVLLLTYKSVQGEGAEYLSDLRMPYVPSRSLISAADNKLFVPKSNYVATQKRAFGIRAPTEWNKLPARVDSLPVTLSFSFGVVTKGAVHHAGVEGLVHHVLFNDARKYVFAKGCNLLEQIPPTRATLLQHVMQATYQGGNIWGQCLVPCPDYPSPQDWGWQIDAPDMTGLHTGQHCLMLL
jgi:hypothetical protein